MNFVSMSEQVIEANNIGIWCQTFGKPKKPAIILTMGAGGQGILWRDEFCQKLADSGRFVVRYDNRDTGKSASFDFDTSPYTLMDMAEDAVGILDAFSIKKAQFVGLSMGGYIAQLCAIHYPERVSSLVSIASTINSNSLRGKIDTSQLPSHKKESVEKIQEIFKRPRESFFDKVEALTDIWRVFNGNDTKFKYDEWNRLAELSYTRLEDKKNAMKNHSKATNITPANRTEDMKNLTVKALFIHGESDPIIQKEHAIYSAQHTKKSELCLIPTMGHLLSSSFDDIITKKILDF